MFRAFDVSRWAVVRSALIGMGLVCMAIGLTACATGPDGRYSKYPTSVSGHSRPHAKPVHRGAKPKKPANAGSQAKGRYKVGDPYQVQGRWYFPAEQPDYDEVGLASWYGDAFHAKATANGELFDMTTMTAAHKTLPLPSIVEVTHLGNGRRIRVRVNDRGPFVQGRIIDLSRAAASALGFAGQGLARVRVRYIGPAPLGSPSEGLVIAAAPPPRRTEVQTKPASDPILANPSVAGPLNGSASFNVVVGAYSDPAAAQRVMDRVRGPFMGSGQVRLVPIARAGGTLYRVVIAGLANEAQAITVSQNLSILGLPGAMVIYPDAAR